MANKTGKGGFTKGTSGNPSGRPPKARALSEALRVRCERSYAELSEILLSIALTGETVTASGEVVTAKLSERLDVIKFLYAQIDGAPPKAVTEETEGDLTVKVVQDDEKTNS